MNITAAHGAKGLETRNERARIRREVGEASSVGLSLEVVAAVLEDQPLALSKMLVWEVVGWAWHRAGSQRCDRRRRLLLRDAGIGEFRLVRELTDRQRDALCLGLRSPVAPGSAW